MNIRRLRYVFISFILLLTVFLNRAYAYLNTDTGAFLFDAIFPFIFAILLLAPWIWGLTDILKNEFRGTNKVIWLVVVRLVPVIGFILYFLIGRKQKI